MYIDELLYGKIKPNAAEQYQMVVGELGLIVWKQNMIMPLKDSMVELLLDEFDKQRNNVPMTNSPEVIAGTINSFVTVQEYRKSYALEVIIFVYDNIRNWY